METVEQYGLTPFYTDQIHDETLSPARVTAVHRERYRLMTPSGEAYGRLKSSHFFDNPLADYPAAGDFVAAQPNPDGDWVITRTLSRKSKFVRTDPDRGRGEQVVAANFDWVFLLQSLNKDFNPSRLERYLSIAWQSGGTPVVILTKADLCDDPTPMLERAVETAVGVDVLVVSAHTGDGLAALAPYLKAGSTSVLLGSSGVGKSSLINALLGSERMKVNDIREDDAKGRHTTTHRELLRLASGAVLMDTPGMRELALAEAREGICETFSDLEELTLGCRFTDCRHENEPGCAVREAIHTGQLTVKRWENYVKLLKEEKRAANKQAAMLERARLHKSISRQIRREERNKR